MDKDSGASPPISEVEPTVGPIWRPPWMSIVVDIARHALPLVSLYLLQGDIGSYLLLTAFDLSLGLVLIVGTTRDRGDPTTVDPRSRSPIVRLLTVPLLAVFFAITAAIVTVPIGGMAFFLGLVAGVDWWDVLSHRTFWIPVAGMSLFAAARAQLAFDAVTTVGTPGGETQAAALTGKLEEDRKRSSFAYGAQVALIATFVLLCFLLVHFGSWGLYAFPVLFAALLVFYDARPELIHRLFPEFWRHGK
jgi:hypothetical protein